MATAKPTPRRKRSTKRVSLSLDRSGGANPADAPGADINTIVAQYKKHGTLPNVAKLNPLYGDFTFGEDLQTIRIAMDEASDRFDNLPADIRSAADNDWGKFIEMFNDPDQKELLQNAGLIISENPDTAKTPPNPPPQPPTDPPKTDD